MAVSLPAGISASPRPAQETLGGMQTPVHVLYKARQESCTSPAAPAWFRGAPHQPCLPHQLEKLPHKDREGSEGSSRLLPAPRPLGWGWEAAGCCQHSPGAAPHRSYRQRHQVTAARKGESREAGTGESSGRELESLSCAPRGDHHRHPPAAPHPAFAALGPALGLHPGGGTGPSGQELAGAHIPKIPTSIAVAQGIPASIPSSACPLSATTRALPPARSRHRDIPQTWPDTSRPTASRCVWHPGRRRRNHQQIPSATLLHHQKYPTPVIPSAGEAAQGWGQKLSLGQDRPGPGTPGCYHVFLFFLFFSCFVNTLSLTICPSSRKRRRERCWQYVRPAPGYTPSQFPCTICGEGTDAAPTSADGPGDVQSAQGFASERRRHCDAQARPELAPATPPGCRRLPQHTGEVWSWILKDWVGKGDYEPEKGVPCLERCSELPGGPPASLNTDVPSKILTFEHV